MSVWEAVLLGVALNAVYIGLGAVWVYHECLWPWNRRKSGRHADEQ